MPESFGGFAAVKVALHDTGERPTRFRDIAHRDRPASSSISRTRGRHIGLADGVQLCRGCFGRSSAGRQPPRSVMP